jgi:hypothetical protein
MPKKKNIVKLKSINDFRHVSGRASGTAKVNHKSVHWHTCNAKQSLKPPNYMLAPQIQNYPDPLNRSRGQGSLRNYTGGVYTREEISPITILLQTAQFIGLTRISDPRGQFTPPVYTHFVKFNTPCWNDKALGTYTAPAEPAPDKEVNLPDYVNYTPYDYLPQAGGGGLVK